MVDSEDTDFTKATYYRLKSYSQSAILKKYIDNHRLPGSLYQSVLRNIKNVVHRDIPFNLEESYTRDMEAIAKKATWDILGTLQKHWGELTKKQKESMQSKWASLSREQISIKNTLESDSKKERARKFSKVTKAGIPRESKYGDYNINNPTISVEKPGSTGMNAEKNHSYSQTHTVVRSTEQDLSTLNTNNGTDKVKNHNITMGPTQLPTHSKIGVTQCKKSDPKGSRLGYTNIVKKADKTKAKGANSIHSKSGNTNIEPPHKRAKLTHTQGPSYLESQQAKNSDNFENWILGSQDVSDLDLLFYGNRQHITYNGDKRDATVNNAENAEIVKNDNETPKKQNTKTCTEGKSEADRDTVGNKRLMRDTENKRDAYGPSTLNKPNNRTQGENTAHNEEPTTSDKQTDRTQRTVDKSPKHEYNQPNSETNDTLEELLRCVQESRNRHKK